MIRALLLSACLAVSAVAVPPIGPPTRTVPVLPVIDACTADFTAKIFILRDMRDRNEITEEQRRQAVAFFIQEYLACKARQRATQPAYIPYRDRQGLD